MKSHPLCVLAGVLKHVWICRWFSARLHYFQRVSNGDTAVLYLAIGRHYRCVSSVYTTSFVLKPVTTLTRDISHVNHIMMFKNLPAVRRHISKQYEKSKARHPIYNVSWYLGKHCRQFKRDPVSMMTSSNGNIFRVTGLCAGNSPVTGEFPAQRAVTRSFDVFFDLRPNNQLSKQSWGWRFETPSRPLWRHCINKLEHAR